MRQRRVQKASTIQGAWRTTAVFPLGRAAVDARFRRGGLEAGVHHVTGAEPRDGAGERAKVEDGVAALGFGAALLARAQSDPAAQALVVQEADAAREHGALYAPGLKAMGVDPDRLALVAARGADEALAAADEAIRSGAFRAVMLELRRGEARLDLTVTRRFNLAAARSGTLVLLVTPTLGSTSAALSRWTVRPAASVGPDPRMLGPPAFLLDLVKNRAGPTGAFSLEWDCDARVFHPIADAAERGRPQPQPRQAAREGPAPVAARLPARRGAAA